MRNLHITGLYAQTAYTAVWVPFARSASPPTLTPPHIFCALELLRNSFVAHKKRRIQPGTLNAMPPKFWDIVKRRFGGYCG